MFYSKPWLHFDWVFALSSEGKKFKKNCDFVHSISENLIKKRKEALVRTKSALN